MNHSPQTVAVVRTIIAAVALASFATAAAALFFNLPLAMAAALVAYAGKYLLVKA